MSEPGTGQADAQLPEQAHGDDVGHGAGELDGESAPTALAAQGMVAAVAALRDRLSLTNVRMQRLSAETLNDPPWTPHSIHVSSQPPEFRLDESSLACRFEQSVELLDDEREPLARASACAVVEFDLRAPKHDGDATAGDRTDEPDVAHEPDPGVVELFVRENGYFIAYPYLRQAIHDLTARLGFDAVVLGVLARGHQRPDHVALVRPQRPTQPDEPRAD